MKIERLSTGSRMFETQYQLTKEWRNQQLGWCSTSDGIDVVVRLILQRLNSSNRKMRSGPRKQNLLEVVGCRV